SSLAGQFHIRFNSSVEQYHIGGIDFPPTRRLLSPPRPTPLSTVTNQSPKPPAPPQSHPPTLHILFDDLCPIPLSLSDDVRLALVDVNVLSERLQTFGHFQAHVSGADNCDALCLRQSLVNSNGMVEVRQGDDVLQAGAGNLR